MKCYLYLVAVGQAYRRVAETAAQRWLALLPELSGVVIGSEEEVSRFGLQFSNVGEVACALKLYVWHLLPDDAEAVLYADLDLVPINPLKPEVALTDVEMAVVRDRWDVEEVRLAADCHGIARLSYFNAGMFYARRSSAVAFDGALRFVNKLPYQDQTALNLARIFFSLKTAWLPWRCNALDATGTEYGLAGIHNQSVAWPAWESGCTPLFTPFPHPDELIRRVSNGRNPGISVSHLKELYQLAKGARDVLAVCAKGFLSTWVLAAAGALVTRVGTEKIKSGRMRLDGLVVDSDNAVDDGWLRQEETLFDLLYLEADTLASPLALQTAWSRCRAGGVLALLCKKEEMKRISAELESSPSSVSLDDADQALCVWRREGEEKRRARATHPEFVDGEGDCSLIASGSGSEADLREELTEHTYRYIRIGYDQRLMEFDHDGGIGTGAARCEMRWSLRLEGGVAILELLSPSSVTCRLTRDANGNWKGKWLAFEQMDITLLRLEKRRIDQGQCGRLVFGQFTSPRLS